VESSRDSDRGRGLEANVFDRFINLRRSQMSFHHASFSLLPRYVPPSIPRLAFMLEPLLSAMIVLLDTRATPSTAAR
jgi:hypothetical protein